MDALNMGFPDNSFDLVWACESGEHMPDKKAYVDEMVRVLKPGGTLVIATWCQREERPDAPFRCRRRPAGPRARPRCPTVPRLRRAPFPHAQPRLSLLPSSPPRPRRFAFL
jgi:SAM-dependent methyltransferase